MEAAARIALFALIFVLLILLGVEAKLASLYVGLAYLATHVTSWAVLLLALAVPPGCILLAKGITLK